MSALEVLAEQILSGAVGLMPNGGGGFDIYVQNGHDRIAEMYHERAVSTDAEEDPEAFLDRVRALDAADKIAAMQAMGFTPIGSDHQPDCPYALDADNRCNCVPDPTMWSPPHDVLVYTNETYDERRRAPRKRIPDVER